MARKMAFFFLWILAVNSALPAAFAQVMTCQEAAGLVLRSTTNPNRSQLTSMEEVAGFLLTESHNPSTSCPDHIIERGLFELGNMTERFSKTFANDPRSEKFWAGKAAEAFTQYVNWWLELDEVRQTALVGFLLGIPRETSTSESDLRKIKWVRDRVGGALFSLMSCLIRAERKSEMLTSLECIAAQGSGVFSVRVINEWHYWLQALPEMQRRKSVGEIEKLLADDLTVRQHWEAFATLREQFISANPIKEREWPLPKSLEGS